MTRYRFEDAVDLTQTLQNGMPVYPGDPEPSFEASATLEKNGVNLTRITIGSHTGTHIDAPMHFISNGVTIDQIPVRYFVGEAVVADLSYNPIGHGITRSDLEKTVGPKIKEGDAVLCYTGSSERWGDPETNRNFSYLDLDGARYLVSKKIRAVGIDFLSVEKFGFTSPDSHKELLGNGIYIIESLSNKLKLFLNQRILLVALPIKLGGRDGAPCRAIAIQLELAQ
jgi:arylformamidase